MAELPPWLQDHAAAPLGALIDHTLLQPEATSSDVDRICDEARQFGLGTVCVNGQWVDWAAGRLGGAAARELGDSQVRPIGIAAVIGFPLGANGPRVKAAETLMAIAGGASEIDVVQALGWAKEGDWKRLQAELTAVVDAAQGAAVKVILETAALSVEEIERSCEAAQRAGAAFVKTSTGFHKAGGATEDAVALLRRCVGEQLGVKASGGIRTAEDAIRMLLAGADRIGTSAAATWDPAVLSRKIGDLVEL